MACPVVEQGTIRAGSGTLTTRDGVAEVTRFAWTSATPTAREGHGRDPIAMSELGCVLLDETREVPMDSGTATPNAAGIDVHGNGLYSLRFDVHVSLGDVSLDLDGLVGEVRFDTHQCGGGSNWGFWDL